jgi:hypothetical protein
VSPYSLQTRWWEFAVKGASSVTVRVTGRVSRLALFFLRVMNRTDNYQHASLFGPPSELINVGELLQAVNGATSSVPELHSMDKTSISSWQEWTTLSEEQKQEIEDECR